MSYVSRSKIERFRVRYHGADSRLRLLKRADGTAKKYSLVALCSKGFFIGRDFDSQENRQSEFLTLDLTKANVNRADLTGEVIAVDLILPDATVLRYSLGSRTTPSFIGDRFVHIVNANFNDKNEIV